MSEKSQDPVGVEQAVVPTVGPPSVVAKHVNNRWEVCFGSAGIMSHKQFKSLLRTLNLRFREHLRLRRRVSRLAEQLTQEESTDNG